MYVEIRPGDGSDGLQGTLTPPGRDAPPSPRIPKGFGPAADGGARRATVSAERGGTRFRLLARSAPFADSTLILGVPLKDTDTTLDQLRLIMLLVACAVIASALLLGLWLITASLRPLRRIEETAAAIGAGDLSRRVEPDGGTTEIGRLGGALNAMLGQIEDAFAERSASEARLRRFISDASHELRTPVAAVSAYAELFDRGARDRPDDLARSMTGIQRETRRMGLLVERPAAARAARPGAPARGAAARSDGARRRGGRCRARDGARPGRWRSRRRPQSRSRATPSASAR